MNADNRYEIVKWLQHSRDLFEVIKDEYLEVRRLDADSERTAYLFDELTGMQTKLQEMTDLLLAPRTPTTNEITLLTHGLQMASDLTPEQAKEVASKLLYIMVDMKPKL